MIGVCLTRLADLVQDPHQQGLSFFSAAHGVEKVNDIAKNEYRDYSQCNQYYHATSLFQFPRNRSCSGSVRKKVFRFLKTGTII